MPLNDRLRSLSVFKSRVYGAKACFGEDTREAFPQTKVAVSLRRDDSRIAAVADGQLKAPIDYKLNGNSAFFSAERDRDFCSHLESPEKFDEI